MRLYKAFLNEEYEVLSYEELKDIEDVFCSKEDVSYKIPKDLLKDYVEMAGYITVHDKENKDKSYIMYLDIDYQFNGIWDTSTSIYVTDQIKKVIRDELMFSIIEEGFSEEDISEGIIGESNIMLNEVTYVFHKYKGGIWNSNEPSIVEIDSKHGLIKGKKEGKSTHT